MIALVTGAGSNSAGVGIASRGFLIIPSVRGRSTRLLNRLTPLKVSRAISDGMLRRASKHG